ncbi:MAG: hypothetical protein AAGD00_00275 [Planctomycetota bacterium]
MTELTPSDSPEDPIVAQWASSAHERIHRAILRYDPIRLIDQGASEQSAYLEETHLAMAAASEAPTEGMLKVLLCHAFGELHGGHAGEPARYVGLAREVWSIWLSRPPQFDAAHEPARVVDPPGLPG